MRLYCGNAACMPMHSIVDTHGDLAQSFVDSRGLGQCHTRFGNASFISSNLLTGRKEGCALLLCGYQKLKCGPFRTCSVGMEASSSSVGFGGPCILM
jgi:hypothetical protein